MFIDIGAPAALVFGAVRFAGEPPGRACLLGAALQHPPVNLQAQAASAWLVSGPRAETGLAFLERLGPGPAGRCLEAEIDLAIPAYMGLASDPMLGLSLARAWAWANGSPPEDIEGLAAGLGLEARHGLFAWAFARGGLLLCDTHAAAGALPALRERREIAHEDKQAWALVLVLPHPADDEPETLEDDRLRQLLAAAEHLSPESGRLLAAEIWPAVAADDLERFARALLELRRLNEEALAALGGGPSPRPGVEEVLQVMQANGALAWGTIPTGLGQFALVRGAQKTRELRTVLQHHVGYFGGTVMATILDNRGAQHVVKEGRLPVCEFRL